MELTTARTRLRRFTAADLENLRRLEGNPEVMRFTGPGRAQTAEESAERLARLLQAQAQREPFGIWAAELHDGSFIGWFMLLASEESFHELGFMMVPEAWGRGLATEIAARLIRYALDEKGLPGVSAITSPKNFASIRVLEKLGFTRVERASKSHADSGKTIEIIRFDKLR